MAQRFGVVEQLAQFHADPGRVDHPHVQRQQPRQPVERARVVAGEPHGARPGDGVTVVPGQGDLLEGEREGLAGCGVVDVHRPGQGARGAGAGLVAAEHRVEHRCRALACWVGQGLELLAAPPDDRCGGRHHAGEHAGFAERRERHLEAALLRHRGQRIELELQPGRVVGAQVHRQGLGQRAQPARLLGAIHPDLERAWRTTFFGRQFTDEECEVTEGVVHHEGPGGIAAGQVGPARPAQRGQHRRGQALQGQPPVRVVDGERRRRRRRRRGAGAQDRTQHIVGPVGGQALESRLPGLQVQILEIRVRVVGRDVDGLGDGRVDVGRDRCDHLLVGLCAHFQRGDEGVGEWCVRALQVPVQPPGVVLDRVFAKAAVGHAFLACVGPAEGWLDAVAGVVGKGQADGAGGCDRQQVRVAQPMHADAVLEPGGQARRETLAAQVQVGVEQRERPALAGQLDRRVVGRVAQRGADLAGHRACVFGVVTQVEHHQRVAQPGETQAHPALVARFLLLLRQRPDRDVEHVVEHARGDRGGLGESGMVETCVGIERVAHKPGQVERAEAAAAVSGQRLLTAVVDDDSVGVEGVDLAHRDVVDRLHTIFHQGVDGGSEALAVQGPPVGGQREGQASGLLLVLETDALCVHQQVLAADHQFVDRPGGVVPMATAAVGHPLDAADVAFPVDRRCDAHAQQHPLHRLQQGRAGLCQAHADALVLAALNRAVGIEQAAQQAGTEARGCLLHGRCDELPPGGHAQLEPPCRDHRLVCLERAIADQQAHQVALLLCVFSVPAQTVAVVVQHDLVAAGQRRGVRPFGFHQVTRLAPYAPHGVVCGQAQLMPFTRAQAQHGFGAGREESLGRSGITPPVDHGSERTTDQLLHLPRAVLCEYPGVRGHAWIRGRDRLAIRQVVVAVDLVQEQHAGFGMVVGGAHDPVPQVTGRELPVNPGAAAVSQCAGMRAGCLLRGPGLGAVDQLDAGAILHRLHEGVCDTDRDVEVLQVATVLGADEFLDVRVVAAQYAHLGPAPRTGGFDGLAGAVKNMHVTDRPGGAALGAADPGAARTDAREVITHAAALAHGLCGLRQRDVDARVAVFHLGDRVAHRLHEAVDQGGRQVGAGGGLDAPGGQKALLQGVQEAGFPVFLVLGRLGLCECAGDAPVDVQDVLFVALGVLLAQHLFADGLGLPGAGGGGRGLDGVGHGGGGILQGCTTARRGCCGEQG